MSKLPNTTAPESPLDEAARLIASAVAPAADVETIERDLDHLVLTLRSRKRGRPTSVTLRDGMVGDVHAEGGTNVVLVLRDAPTERHRRLRLDDRQFVDLGSGTVRLHVPGLLVDLTGVELDVRPPRVSRRVALDPFADRTSRVARTFVEQPDRVWGTREIAAEAGVSTMTASHAIRQLRELGVLDVRSRGRAIEATLLDVRTLVEHWTRAYDWRRSTTVRVHAPIGSPERFLPRLTEVLGGRRWALTMQAGASLVAPHAAWDMIHVYVADPVDEIVRGTGWLSGAGKLAFVRPYYTDSVWVGLRDAVAEDRLPVVSDLQLILDLWHYPVRGREQAEVLLARLEQRVREARERTA